MTRLDDWSVGTAFGTPTDHVRSTTLPNGLRVLTDEQPRRAAVALSAWVAVGSRDEPDREAGSSHFLEHLLFKGTSRRTARDIAVAMDAVGGDMNAFTSSEHTAFYATAPATDAPMVLDLLLDLIANPTLSGPDVESERNVILEELAAARQDPDDMAGVALSESLFPGHPLGRETLGTTGTVGSISRDQVAGFFGRWYVPTNIVIAAAGAVDHERVVEAVRETFDDRAGGDAPERIRPPDEVVPRAFTEHPGDLTHVALGWRAPSVDDPDRHALSILNHAFGGGPSSVLFQEIRENRGLTYSVGSDVAQYGDAGSLSVHCATRVATGSQLVDVIDDLAERIATEGMDDATLQRVKGAVRGGVVMAMESIVSRMTRLGAGQLALGEVTPLADYLERISAVSTEDVLRVARRVFGSPRSLSIVGPRDLED